MNLLTTLKAKLYAIFALFTIAGLAYVKWLHASNEAKAEKIADLKKQKTIAKAVSKMEVDVAGFTGFQEAIDAKMKELAKATTHAEDERKLDEDWSDSNYDSNFR